MNAVRAMSLVALAGLAAGFSAGASAQVFRIVGPDGRVTFSDRPPADASTAKAAPTVQMPAGGNTSSLPFELRNVTGRYPVTLYTGPDCGPCLGARSFLATRGVPFTERTVTSEEDIEALKRMAGQARLPFLTIGSQQLKGYSESEWTQYLDAAGYPKTSQLPANWRNPAPTPLVAAQPAPERRPTATAQPPGQPQVPTPSASSEPPPPPNPAGIRF